MSIFIHESSAELLDQSKDVRVICSKNSQKNNMLVEAWNYLLWVYEKRSLIAVITSIELKRSIVQTKLTYAWWLLDPFLNFLCYLFLVMILGHNNSVRVPYPLFMITAILPWHFTMKTIMNSATLWDKYSSLIGQIRFPYIDLIISSLLYELVLYLVSQIIVFAICIAYGFFPTTTWLYLPIIIALQVFLSFGLMLFNSLIAFSFFDYQKLLPFLLRIWFFVSPAVWAIEMLPPKYQQLVYLNPMTIIFQSYRRVLLYGESPDWAYLETYFLVTFLMVFVGLILFIRREPFINRYI